MKARIEIELPNSCSECFLCGPNSRMVYKCYITGSELLPVPKNHRSADCPLEIEGMNDNITKN